MTAPFNNNVDAILQLPVGVAIVAADTRLLSWNVQAESISGYTFEQISALGIDRLLHPSDAISSMLHDAHRGVPTLHRRLELHRADGERISISVQCALQSSRDEGAYQAVITFRELMTLQACLRRDDHLLTLGILATSFSHEIRHPLNALFLYIDEIEAAWFEQIPAIRNQMQACVADIKRETTRLDELAQNYLSLAGLDNMPYEPIELATVVEAFVQKLQPLLSAGGMSLRIVLHDRLGEVSLNFNAFLRALLNLARNAIDAMSVGGVLTLRGWCDDTVVRLELHDTGSGIPEAHRPLLFIPFHTSKPDGTGLGLFVTQQILMTHGGDLELTQTSEMGTTFTLSLPLAAGVPAIDHAGSQHAF